MPAMFLLYLLKASFTITIVLLTKKLFLEIHWYIHKMQRSYQAIKQGSNVAGLIGWLKGLLKIQL